MEKTIFEQISGTYTQVGDYFLPDLKLPKEEQTLIGVWGQRHLRYIREHRKGMYFSLLTSGKLNSYLADIDGQAQNMFLQLVEQMAEQESVTESLKVENQMEWVKRMNNIRERAIEVVNCNLIYTEANQVCQSRNVSEIDIPKVFWKYYDLYRRKKITLIGFAEKTKCSPSLIMCYMERLIEDS